jgi:hypothetical protein
LNLDVRRLWECPKCGRRIKLPGDVVTQFCRCGGESSGEGAWMRLVEPKRTIRVERARAVYELSCEDVALEEPAREQTAASPAAESNGQAAAEVCGAAASTGGERVSEPGMGEVCSPADDRIATETQSH